jgi:hypothetical protein
MHSNRVHWSSVLCVLLGACTGLDSQPEDAEDASVAPERIEQQNLAAGRPATQSSTMYPFEAARVVDGNTDGYFPDGSVTHTGLDPQAWWQVDLGAVTDIGKVVLYNRTDCCSGRLADFDVLLSNDGITWQIATVFVGIAPARTELSIAGSGRFVRVRLRGTGYLTLAEAEELRRAVKSAWLGALAGFEDHETQILGEPRRELLRQRFGLDPYLCIVLVSEPQDRAALLVDAAMAEEREDVWALAAASLIEEVLPAGARAGARIQPRDLAGLDRRGERVLQDL